MADLLRAWQDQHYRTLGLKVGATEVEIKTAFKTLARQHHPDKGGNPEKFKEVSAGVSLGVVHTLSTLVSARSTDKVLDCFSFFRLLQVRSAYEALLGVSCECFSTK
jgi:hypothetical protein